MNSLTITGFPQLDYAPNEAMNTLCTNISYCGQNIRKILFTSRYEQEGKSSVAMNVMRTMASYGKRVVLVDADLRRSYLARRYKFVYETEHANGLAQYLAGMCSLEDALYKTDIENAYIIPAGRDVMNSMQLLTSSRYAEMMQTLDENFDMVIVDTPPAGVIVDAVELAKYCDGAVIIVSYNTGRKQEIKDVADNITRAGCKVLGAVMTNVDFSSFRNRKYYYRSGKYSSYYHYYKSGYGRPKKDKSKTDK